MKYQKLGLVATVLPLFSPPSSFPPVPSPPLFSFHLFSSPPHQWMDTVGNRSRRMWHVFRPFAHWIYLYLHLCSPSEPKICNLLFWFNSASHNLVAGTLVPKGYWLCPHFSSNWHKPHAARLHLPWLLWRAGSAAPGTHDALWTIPAERHKV